MISDLHKALLLQFFVAMIWGGGWVVGHMATHEVPALTFGAWQLSVVTLVLGALVLKEHRGLPRYPQKTLILIIIMATIGIFGYNLCFLYGLQYVLPGRAALVVALTPVLVAIGASLLMKERPSQKAIIGILFGTLGCLIVIARGNPMLIFSTGIGNGEYIILCAAFAWTAYTLIGKRVGETVPALVMSFYASLIGCILIWILAIVKGASPMLPIFPIKVYGYLLYLGALASGFCYVWYADGIKTLGATRAAAFSNFVPISSIVLSALILNEHITMPTIIGGGLVLAGVMLTNSQPTKMSH